MRIAVGAGARGAAVPIIAFRRPERNQSGSRALTDVREIHRFGRPETCAQITIVAAASPHLIAAFQAAEFLLDYLKSRAPFWKKEISADGAKWGAAKDKDALNRW